MQIRKLKAIHRLLIGIVLSLIGYFFAKSWSNENSLFTVMVAWILFCIVLLLLDWFTFFTTTPSQIREQAKVQDESAVVIFSMVLLSVAASLTGVFSMIVYKNDATNLSLLCGIGGMISSWCLTHTIFAIRYAHLYYGDHQEDDTQHSGGLNFPDENEKPDFIDFAYFSFVIGMTFQVSDVEIMTKRFRRIVLLHSLVSFAFNTFIVALTINVIAGLSN